MENFAGAVGNWHQGVFFTEGTLTGSISSKGRLHIIQRFEYGQRAHNWWDLIFSFKWDTESWHGSGEAVSIREAL
ncbi:MAG: hypothetical protein DMF26_11770 [Verrucomicrobia bacterium]|nr:MAG: hypothetical protein DMF26_11770 [Verrucomicrobiota bacterium]